TVMCSKRTLCMAVLPSPWNTIPARMGPCADRRRPTSEFGSREACGSCPPSMTRSRSTTSCISGSAFATAASCPDLGSRNSAQSRPVPTIVTLLGSFSVAGNVCNPAARFIAPPPFAFSLSSASWIDSPGAMEMAFVGAGPVGLACAPAIVAIFEGCGAGFSFAGIATKHGSDAVCAQHPRRRFLGVWHRHVLLVAIVLQDRVIDVAELSSRLLADSAVCGHILAQHVARCVLEPKR